MTLQGNKYLDDILFAISLVEKFIIDIKSFEDYSKDLKTQSAVERQIGIICEAANKFDKLGTEDILKNSTQIISLRNRLVHAYDSIDNTIIWAVVKKYLPALKEEIIQKVSK